MEPSTPPTQEYEAAKAFTMAGRAVSPGDHVDVSALPVHKLGQLLNQRFIQPIKLPATDA